MENDTHLCVTGLHLIQVTLNGATFQCGGNYINPVRFELLEETGGHDQGATAEKY